jgi:hypothetical protein
MSVRTNLAAAMRALLGVPIYDGKSPLAAAGGYDLNDPVVERARELRGGSLTQLRPSQTRWFEADLESAQIQADNGRLQMVGQLCKAMQGDGLISGLLSTRTSGLIALPRHFVGKHAIVAALEERSGSRTVWDEMCPPAELAALAGDGIQAGAGVGELIPVANRPHPVLVRYEPEHLEYRQYENQWYLNTLSGPIRVNPGDGRWVLHVPGGKVAPWNQGAWKALGRAYVDKTHARLHRANYSGKLANPARIAKTPAAATETQRWGFVQRLLAWGINTVVELPPGYEATLLESNGRGWEVFSRQVEDANLEIMIRLAGQVVTVTGGTGFANADIHKTIRSDLIKQTADDLAYTCNTQILPTWSWLTQGQDQRAIDESPLIGWHTDPPEDRKTESDVMKGLADGMRELAESLRAYGLDLDVEEVARRFGIPTVEIKDSHSLPTDLDRVAKAADMAQANGLRVTQDRVTEILTAVGLKTEALPAAAGKKVRLDLAPTDLARVVRADEARLSQGLDPLGDERGDLMISEIGQLSDGPDEPSELGEGESSNAEPK